MHGQAADVKVDEDDLALKGFWCMGYSNETCAFKMKE